jgi:DNA repair photolyase
MCSCSHYGCHYCYARATHPYLGLNAGEDFATRIMVKTNMPDVLERELTRPGWPRERVAIGTATDAYQPCEGRYQVTRRCLEALRDAHTPVSIVTKSTLVLRDLDLLKQLAVLPGTQVNFTITTLDLTLWRLIEPGTPPPAQRLAVMRRLTDAGVACSVFIAPILPGLTDSEQSIASVAAAAREHGATVFWQAPCVWRRWSKSITSVSWRSRFPNCSPATSEAILAWRLRASTGRGSRSASPGSGSGTALRRTTRSCGTKGMPCRRRLRPDQVVVLGS